MAIDVTRKKFGIFSTTLTWFNKDTELRPASKSVIHVLKQSVPISNSTKSVCLNKSAFLTLIIDLTQSEEHIWKNMEPKSCRYEIRKMHKLIDKGEAIQVKYNCDLDKFIQIANNYIKAKEMYANFLKPSDLTVYLDNKVGEFIGIYYNDNLVGGNFYLRDHPHRVRLLHSFNDRFKNKDLEKLTGPLMRYLHWHAILKKYKKEGFLWYDMGGITQDKNSVAYGITKFKLSFGGNIQEEYDYVFAHGQVTSRLIRFYKSIVSKS